MDTGSILSFTSPLSETERVEVLPAPVFELAYAAFYVAKRSRRQPIARTEPDWYPRLRMKESALLDALRDFWPEESDKANGTDLFILAAELGYARDPSPRRFLEDLPELPERILGLLRRQGEGVLLEGDLPDEHQERFRAIRQSFGTRMEGLAAGGRGRAFAALLGRLWSALEPTWNEEGRAQVEAACRRFMEDFRATGDVLAALPPHHFTKLEESARLIRTSQERGRIVVSPLYFATGGGINITLHEAHFIGYGLESESLHEDAIARVGDLAVRMKAFSDPTRLMLLSLIGRFTSFPLTVGDLALQLGVSQPTVSGHLKVLREAGLVTFEKKGNRSFYLVNADQIRSLLTDLEEELQTCK